jgi:hypothetical protein
VQIRELEYAVFKRGDRLRVFEEIDDRITANEKRRAEAEASLWWEIEAQKKVNSAQAFDNDNKKMHLESLEDAKKNLDTEMK